MTFESFCETLITIGLKLDWFPSLIKLHFHADKLLKGENQSRLKYDLIKFVHNKNLLGWYTGNLLYTDGQKKCYSRILSGHTCGSQTLAARAYHDQDLE